MYKRAKVSKDATGPVMKFIDSRGSTMKDNVRIDVKKKEKKTYGESDLNFLEDPRYSLTARLSWRLRFPGSPGSIDAANLSY